MGIDQIKRLRAQIKTNPKAPPCRQFRAKILGNRQIFPVPTAPPKVVRIVEISDENVFDSFGGRPRGSGWGGPDESIGPFSAWSDTTSLSMRFFLIFTNQLVFQALSKKYEFSNSIFCFELKI